MFFFPMERQEGEIGYALVLLESNCTSQGLGWMGFKEHFPTLKGYGRKYPLALNIYQ